MSDRWTHPITRPRHPGWARSTNPDNLAEDLVAATRPNALLGLGCLAIGLLPHGQWALYAAAGFYGALGLILGAAAVCKIRAWQWWRRAIRETQP